MAKNKISEFDYDRKYETVTRLTSKQGLEFERRELRLEGTEKNFVFFKDPEVGYLIAKKRAKIIPLAIAEKNAKRFPLMLAQIKKNIYEKI